MKLTSPGLQYTSHSHTPIIRFNG